MEFEPDSDMEVDDRWVDWATALLRGVEGAREGTIDDTVQPPDVEEDEDDEDELLSDIRSSDVEEDEDAQRRRTTFRC